VARAKQACQSRRLCALDLKRRSTCLQQGLKLMESDAAQFYFSPPSP
jgi:hypothetical protein